MPSLFTAILPAPFGRLGLCEAHGALTALVFLPTDTPLQSPPFGSLSALAAQRLHAYFIDPHTPLADLPYQLTGTPFQLRVWQAMLTIPVGATQRYGELANQLGSAPRAVGGACGRNPLPLIVPCHRVVAVTGMGGFNQGKLETMLGIKHWLLQHEAAHLAQ